MSQKTMCLVRLAKDQGYGKDVGEHMAADQTIRPRPLSLARFENP